MAVRMLRQQQIWRRERQSSNQAIQAKQAILLLAGIRSQISQALLGTLRQIKYLLRTRRFTLNGLLTVIRLLLTVMMVQSSHQRPPTLAILLLNPMPRPKQVILLLVGLLQVM